MHLKTDEEHEISNDDIQIELNDRLEADLLLSGD